MKLLRVAGTAAVVVGALGAWGLFAAGVGAQQPAAPAQPMSFFITSVGKGDGLFIPHRGNLYRFGGVW